MKSNISNTVYIALYVHPFMAFDLAFDSISLLQK